MSTSITIPDSVHNSFIHQALGFAGCWSGLAPRIIMIGTLTALQWFIYDGVKVALGLPRYDRVILCSVRPKDLRPLLRPKQLRPKCFGI